MNLSEFGVRRPVPANLLMFAVIAGGLILGVNLKREFFPETRPNQVMVSAPYPGASPDEIEDSLAIKIEDRIADLDDIKEINTTVVEGAATVMIEFESGVRIDDAVARVKREVDALQDLPEQSERITVKEFEPNIPVISVTLFGDIDERTMKNAARQMRDDLLSLPNMGDVLLSGVRPDELSVEAHPDAMLEYGLSLTQISRRIREGMSETPGGAVRTPSSTVILKTVGADDKAAEVRDIVVQSTPNGRPLRVGEIATVTDGFADVDLRTRFNGSSAASITMYATGDQDVIDIASWVKAYVAGRNRLPLNMTLKERLAQLTARPSAAPKLSQRQVAYELGLLRPTINGLTITAHNDLARFVQQRLSLLSRNALWGGLLVFGTLLILLTPRVAMWVTLGLIVSLLGTLAVMDLVGLSLNFLTMFGLIVVLGLLVDDAIVVAENIMSKHEQGEPALQAAINGATQVQWPVFATVLTTIAAFLPLRAIDGRIGDLMGALPVVVALALGMSLIESLFILPSHMAHSLKNADNKKSRKRKAAPTNSPIHDEPTWRQQLFEKTAMRAYVAILEWALRRPFLTTAIAIAVMIASFGMVVGGRVHFEFLTSADAELVVADVGMPIGTPIEKTDAIIRRIERIALAMPEVQSAFSVVGARQDLEGGGESQQGHLGQVYIELKRVEERTRRSDEVIDAIRAELGDLPGVKSLRFEEASGGPGGSDISYAVVGDSMSTILPVVKKIKDRIAEFEGAYSIADDADAGQRELRVKLRPGASELGFTTQNLADQLRGAVFGLKAYTFAGDREDVDVRVKLTEPYRRSLAKLETMHVYTPTGTPVPLAEVAHLEEGEGYATVRRLDRRRSVSVSADVNRSLANPEEIVSAMSSDLRQYQASAPGVQIIARGRQEDMADSFRSMPMGMLAAVAAIYVILAWLFSSYIQPVAVLMAVPFSTVGVIWGHLIMGFDMTILTMIGFVALMGIVVNDSLILMEFYNHKRTEHVSMHDALMATGRARLRAILLTTITTVLGLSPLMLEQSFQARFLIPMAITISFGLIAATVGTLIVLPCLLIIGRDAHRVAYFLLTGKRVSSDLVAWDEAIHADEEITPIG